MIGTPSSSESLAQPEHETGKSRPEMFRHTFHCGYPDELIEATRDDVGELIHNLVTFAMFEADSRLYGSLPVCDQARCLTCAKAAEEHVDRKPRLRPKRTLGLCQAGSALTGFEGVLVRYRRGADRDSNQTHSRVSEADHQAHRLAMLQKTVEYADTWLAVTARRVQNMPIQMKDAARPAPRQQEMSIFEGDEDADYWKSEDVVEAIETMQGLSEISRGNRPEGTDESYRMAAANCISSSASRRERGKRRIAAIATQGQLDPTAADSEEEDYDRMVERYSQEASDSLSSIPSHEALLGRHNAYTNSPLDALYRLTLTLTSHKYEHPRPAPAVSSAPASPRKGALDFIRRRSSASTRGHSRSGSTKMSFHKLSIDIQPRRSLEISDLDSDSPDWACQASRAFERGETLMDSVSKQGRDLMGSKHAPQDVCNPTDRRNTYPSPATDHSPASPRPTKHSEGMPQALRASAARRHGRLVGIKIASPRREADSAQGAPAVDLNKRLPALSPQAGSENGEGQVECI